MKSAEQLTHAQLVDLVTLIVNKLFFDPDAGEFDPENVVDLRDSVEFIGSLLDRRGLAPAHAGDKASAADLSELQRALQLAREVRDVLKKHKLRRAHPKAAALVKSIDSAMRNEISRPFRPSQQLRPRRRLGRGFEPREVTDVHDPLYRAEPAGRAHPLET